jgi:uncharacterized protein YjiS (DUF1127 family)
MTTLYNQIRETLKKRAAYQRTVHELKAMPLDVALDLEIHREDAEKIAAEAVYGRH